ncbi:MAG: transcriptional repressor [Lachnobacterium sp.]|nr:transcriptional repressor [Lachnobacterium sp.]MDD6631289.1 transcriptional repressor [Lachnobacterium sp.]MDY2912951.1 transcriptional repressor [Agathobacter sp.]
MAKYSRQRECILKNLQSRRDHPTADMVYESVQIEEPNISLGTVYRNLSFLTENGQILKISTGIGPDHFDGFTEAHNHFVCRKCGRVLDLDYVADEKIIAYASKNFNGEIKGYDLQFYGTCEDCL